MPELTKEQIDEFLSNSLIARVATTRPDGRPHVVPIWYLWDGTSIYMETPPNFVKARNLRQNPHCAVSIDITQGGLRFQAVVMEGTAEILDDRQYVLDMVTRIYTKYLGAEGVQSPTPQQMINSEHVIIKLTPGRILTWDDTQTALTPIP